MDDTCSHRLPWLTLRCELHRHHVGRHQATDPKGGKQWFGGWNGPWCTECDADGRTCLLPPHHDGDHRFTV